MLNVVNIRDLAPPGARHEGPADAEIEAYIEEIARYFVEAGLPRVAGRLIGALVVAEPREQSAAELAHRLQASRGSISTMSRLLIAGGIAERRTRPGHRREYLRLRDDAWLQVVAGKTRQITELRRVGERGLGLYEGRDGAARASLEELVHLMKFFEREWPPLVDRWLAERATGKGTSGA